MNQIKELNNKLIHHPIYKSLENKESLKIFMKYHSFAVFDFMSLLKSLQSKIAPANQLWTPSKYSNQIIRFINEIVLAEESDLLPNSQESMSHYEMYLSAMKDLSVDTQDITSFVTSLRTPTQVDFNLIPIEARSFVSYNLKVALSGNVEEVIGSFLFGREKLIPDLFQPILDKIKEHSGEASMIHYYFKRHIDIDGDEHGPMAEKCFNEICKTSEQKDIAYTTASIALNERLKLWDNIHSKILEVADFSGQQINSSH